MSLTVLLRGLAGLYLQIDAKDAKLHLRKVINHKKKIENSFIRPHRTHSDRRDGRHDTGRDPPGTRNRCRAHGPNKANCYGGFGFFLKEPLKIFLWHRARNKNPRTNQTSLTQRHALYLGRAATNSF